MRPQPPREAATDPKIPPGASPLLPGAVPGLDCGPGLSTELNVRHMMMTIDRSFPEPHGSVYTTRKMITTFLTPSSSPLTGSLAEEITASYHTAWGVKAVPGRNPAPQPVSLERRHLPLLREHAYIIADKSDGVRMCLFLTRTADGRDHAVLVDRKLSLYQVHVAALRRCFDGSLFDGELMWTTGPDGTHWQTFLVFDAVAWRGDNGEIGQQPLTKRLELIRHTFDLGSEEIIGADAAQIKAKEGKIICGGNAHGLSFRPKQCFPLEMLPTLLRHIQHLPYQSDGLVLTPVDEPVRTGTHETTFKVKWKHTLDLQANPTTKQLLLGAGGIAHNERMDLLNVGLPETVVPSATFWADLKDNLVTSDSPVSVIVECSLAQTSGQLGFVAIRRDKSHPNSMRTAERTLRSMMDNIGSEELLTEVLGQNVVVRRL